MMLVNGYDITGLYEFQNTDDLSTESIECYGALPVTQCNVIEPVTTILGGWPPAPTAVWSHCPGHGDTYSEPGHSALVTGMQYEFNEIDGGSRHYARGYGAAVKHPVTTILPHADRTADGTGEIVDLGFGYASGNLYIQVTGTARGTLLNVTVEHSVDGVTFAPLHVFAQTAKHHSAERQALGAVNRYVRVAWTLARLLPEDVDPIARFYVAIHGGA